mgnify:CR=1 FL=1
MLKVTKKTALKSAPPRVVLDSVVGEALQEVADLSGMKLTHLVNLLLVNAFNKGNAIELSKGNTALEFVGDESNAINNIYTLINELRDLSEDKIKEEVPEEQEAVDAEPKNEEGDADDQMDINYAELPELE